MNKENEKLAMKVSIISVVLNVILSAVKFIAGIVASSGAMISDAIHSASDVISTFIVMFGMKVSNKEADDNHQYGHERIECIAALILAMILIFVGIEIGIAGVEKIFHPSTLEVPGMFALVAAIVSIIMKEGMFWWTYFVGKKVDSTALIADAWHHRSDALSSIGSFVGIFGAMNGYPIMDPIASVVICIFVLKAGYDIFMDAARKLTDESCDKETVEQIRTIVEKEAGVLGIDRLRTRVFSTKIYIDLEIGADGEKSLAETHEIAQRVHDSIEDKMKKVKHCMVHVNPHEAKN